MNAILLSGIGRHKPAYFYDPPDPTPGDCPALPKQNMFQFLLTVYAAVLVMRNLNRFFQGALVLSTTAYPIILQKVQAIAQS